MRRLNSLCVVIKRKSKSKYLDIDMYYISTIIYYIIRDTIVDIYIYINLEWRERLKER